MMSAVPAPSPPGWTRLFKIKQSLNSARHSARLIFKSQDTLSHCVPEHSQLTAQRTAHVEVILTFVCLLLNS